MATIARQHGVSVADLRGVNPNLTGRLREGTLVTLPPPKPATTGSSSTPSSTAAYQYQPAPPRPLPFGATNADVVAGQRTAAFTERGLINWQHPELTLGALSQVDNRQGGNDPSRCGAAAITAGMVLLGPEQAKWGLHNLQRRASELLQRLPQTPRLGPGDGQRQMLVFGASQTIESLRRRDPGTWTCGDVSRLQQAIFDLAVVDAHTPRSSAGGSPGSALLPTDPGMRVELVREYRDLAWNGQTPQFDVGGSPVPVDITFREGGSTNPGHFMLTQGRPGQVDAGTRQVVYDPWPAVGRGGAPYVALMGPPVVVQESTTVVSGQHQDVDRRK